MMDRDSSIWYPKLFNWRNWEIPRPGREALLGFLIVMAVSLALHGFVIWMCSWFRR